MAEGIEGAAGRDWVVQQEVNLVKKEAFDASDQYAMTTALRPLPQSQVQSLFLGDRERSRKDSYPTKDWAWGQRSENPTTPQPSNTPFLFFGLQSLHL